MLQVISKASGWITVTPRKKDRKHPIEKQALGDVKKVNVLSPVWMQVDHKAPEHDPMQPFSVKTGVRKEVNRTFLVEKKQPRRSIFALGSVRHNVPTKEEADKYQQQAIDRGFAAFKEDRIFEWKEKQGQQGYDRAQVSPKIGSAHFY